MISELAQEVLTQQPILEQAKVFDMENQDWSNII